MNYFIASDLIKIWIFISDIGKLIGLLLFDYIGLGLSDQTWFAIDKILHVLDVIFSLFEAAEL